MSYLTSKQARFVEEYLVDLNATQAAARAGYSDPNYGRQLITKSNVQEAIQAAKVARCERTRITADMVVRELAAIAFCRLTDLCSWDTDGVTLLTSEDLSDRAKAGAFKVKVGKDGEVEVALGKKVEALKLLAQHTGVVGADVQVNVNNSIEEALALLEERRAKREAKGPLAH